LSRFRQIATQADCLLIVATPAGHERFFRAAGEPAPAREFP
jgi:hypothetical protein